VARALLAEVEARAAAEGAAMATLEVRRSNEPARALYRTLGYQEVGVRPRYYAEDGEDAILMDKDLRHGAI
jgi:ribosomal-protein-alanine N-acetyltransferase